ncbi:MAG: glutamate synthase subunit beta, partial [Cellulomonadaceae bacterium]|nr:glutamate synthase subunit beta [Cellulomonadaceae bacterium]
MADPNGFQKIRERQTLPDRPVEVRVSDWCDTHEPLPEGETHHPFIKEQASRCMDCGVPFCHFGCPLGNLIPEWNDLVWRGQWSDASARMHVTNNFPEITGRICPAPCESSCVLGIVEPPVTIRNVEMSIADHEFAEALEPLVPATLTGATVAVVGSGPAGLACAQQLTRAGHTVVVYERADAIGGLLRYGIPDFKLEKHLLDRRIAQMEAEGTRFRPNTTIGADITWADLRRRFDAVVCAIGSTVPIDLNIPGRDLQGIHFAMDFLVPANREVAGSPNSGAVPNANGKSVVIIGGGDTGSDCLGTALRQGAASVTTLSVLGKPPAERPDHEPWPTMPLLLNISSSHQEGGSVEYLANTV